MASEGGSEVYSFIDATVGVVINETRLLLFLWGGSDCADTEVGKQGYEVKYQDENVDAPCLLGKFTTEKVRFLVWQDMTDIL